MCLRELDNACGSPGSVRGTEWGLQNVKSQCHPPRAALDAFPVSQLTHPKDSEAVARPMLFASHLPRLVLLSWDHPDPGMSGTFWDLAGSEHCKDRIPTSWRVNPLSGCPRSQSENLIGDLKSNDSGSLLIPPSPHPTNARWMDVSGRRRDHSFRIPGGTLPKPSTDCLSVSDVVFPPYLHFSIISLRERSWILPPPLSSSSFLSLPLSTSHPHPVSLAFIVICIQLCC